MLSDGNDIGTRHFSHSNTAVGLVGGIEVDMVRSNTGSDGDLQLLCLGQSLGGEVAGMEAVVERCQL